MSPWSIAASKLRICGYNHRSGDCCFCRACRVSNRNAHYITTDISPCFGPLVLLRPQHWKTSQSRALLPNRAARNIVPTVPNCTPMDCAKHAAASSAERRCKTTRMAVVTKLSSLAAVRASLEMLRTSLSSLIVSRSRHWLPSAVTTASSLIWFYPFTRNGQLITEKSVHFLPPNV